MDKRAPLLMIPGPIEVSPAVREAFGVPPPGHLAPSVIETFGASLEMMREVWKAGPGDRPFVVAGGGTVAMDMAAVNLVEPGDAAVVVNTGYFSSRMAEMLRRQGAAVLEVGEAPGNAPSPDQVRQALERDGTDRIKVLCATHVDTSTGVRVDPAPLATLARELGAVSVFDGVCATAAERFEMEAWGADVYLTGSQKAIGLPAGLALMVVSERALEVRRSRTAMPPAMYLDWEEWLPIMTAYEERRPAYFSTPATNLIVALRTGLEEILADGIEARFALHDRAARALHAAWQALGLGLVPARGDLTANTLSALYYPDGVDASLVGKVAEHGVIVAGGLHPAIRNEYFRVGHMGYCLTRPDMLTRTVEAIGSALRDSGVAVDPGAAVGALEATLNTD